jgi:hypothetical protein
VEYVHLKEARMVSHGSHLSGPYLSGVSYMVQLLKWTLFGKDDCWGYACMSSSFFFRTFYL